MPFFLMLPATILIALVLLPSRFANLRISGFRNSITVISAIQFFVSACFLLSKVAAVGAASVGDLTGTDLIYVDGISSLMLTLVSFVGWIICRYSVRYLDGESNQGRYFQWTGFTIGSVSLMVISGNFMLFFIAWVMTSLGLHQLLLHYGHRSAAQRAAWTKFTISRMGDAALLVAIGLIYWEFNTLNFARLFESAASVSSASGKIQLAGFLLVVGAITKSAQFPFHTWLPLTMETPTPVSALMHAGIVNAGGFLMIRMSPIVGLTSSALILLTVVGAVTACFGAVVMLTQSSVKKSLAYSTIAQMGFMMLQCGLGAFSAAMLHIVAHSLYKAHAFLSSGSVLNEVAGSRAALSIGKKISFVGFCVSAVLSVSFLIASFSICGIDPLEKPGGLLLGGILCLGLTHWLANTLNVKSLATSMQAFSLSFGMCLVYAASFKGVGWLIGSDLTSYSAELFSRAFLIAVGAIIFSAFSVMFLLASRVEAVEQPRWLTRFYIHASNGFYFENRIRRLFNIGTR